MTGKLKTKGNMMTATKLENVLKVTLALQSRKQIFLTIFLVGRGKAEGQVIAKLRGKEGDVVYV